MQQINFQDHSNCGHLLNIHLLLKKWKDGQLCNLESKIKTHSVSVSSETVIANLTKNHITGGKLISSHVRIILVLTGLSALQRQETAP